MHVKRGHLLGRAWSVYDNNVDQCSLVDNARKNRPGKPRPTLKLLAIYVAILFLVWSSTRYCSHLARSVLFGSIE